MTEFISCTEQGSTSCHDPTTLSERGRSAKRPVLPSAVLTTKNVSTWSQRSHRMRMAMPALAAGCASTRATWGVVSGATPGGSVGTPPRGPNPSTSKAIGLLLLLSCTACWAGETKAKATPPVASRAPGGPSPWHRELHPCPSTDSALGAVTAEVGDVDGDGRADLAVAVCGQEPGREQCAVQLCLRDQTGTLLLAASWLAERPELIRPTASAVPPHSLESHPAYAVGPCFTRRSFQWHPGEAGYLVGDIWCECSGRRAEEARCGR